MVKGKDNGPRLGSSFDSFLESEGIKADVEEAAREALEKEGFTMVDFEDPEQVDALIHRTMDMDAPPDEPRVPPVNVAVEEPWLGRLRLLAKRVGIGESEYLAALIELQWMASGDVEPGERDIGQEVLDGVHESEHDAGCRYEQDYPAIDPEDCPRCAPRTQAEATDREKSVSSADTNARPFERAKP